MKYYAEKGAHSYAHFRPTVDLPQSFSGTEISDIQWFNLYQHRFQWFSWTDILWICFLFIFNGSQFVLSLHLNVWNVSIRTWLLLEDSDAQLRCSGGAGHTAAAPLSRWNTASKRNRNCFCGKKHLVYSQRKQGDTRYPLRSYLNHPVRPAHSAPLWLQHSSTQVRLPDLKFLIKRSRCLSATRGTDTHTHTACGSALSALYFYVGLLSLFLN